MKPPIAILFANLKGNIGDFAILHAMLLSLKNRFPGQPLHVFPHGFYNVDEKRLAAFKALIEEEFKLAGVTYFTKVTPKLLQRMIKSIGLWPFVQAHLVRSLTDQVVSDAAQFREYDAIFLAGGDHWGGTEGGISMFGTLRAVHHHNDRIYAFPFSLKSSIRQFNTNQDLQSNFRNIRGPLIARDSITKGVMDKLGVESVLGIDSVFSLQDVADDVDPISGRDRSRIILAITGGRRRLEADLRSALSRLNIPKAKIELMTTCELEDGDRYATISREFGISLLAPATWQAAVAEIKASALLVTNRLHGLILGCLANTPLLPVTDRMKAEAFARDADMPYRAASARAVTSGLLERCLSDREAILIKMNHYKTGALNLVHSPLSWTPNR